MRFIWNLLAIIGLVALIGLVFGYQKFGSDMALMRGMSPETKATYSEMWSKLKETGNSADATVWKVPLAEDVTKEDAEEAMKIVANDANIKAVGELPLSEQVELQTGQPQRFLKIYQFCDPETAMKMVDYSDAFSAYLPCRVALVEDKEGHYNLYSLNMDLMIYGGDPLPEALHNEALRVKEVIQKIMSSGASGEFF